MSRRLKFLQAILIPLFSSILLSIVLNTCSTIVSIRWYYGVGFLTALTLVFMIICSYQAGTKSFTELLLASIVIRLLFSLVALLICAFLDKPNFLNFSIHFMMHYVLFTIFEMRYLLFLIKSTRTKK